eukprot:5124963-Pyramimonas_sp.AAC.1
MLPITATRGSRFVPHASANHKGAVKWESANPYRRALTMLLQHTGGINVNQNSFFKAAQKFNADKCLKLSGDEVERGAYRLRVSVSQMGNMISKDRAGRASALAEGVLHAGGSGSPCREGRGRAGPRAGLRAERWRQW